MPNTPDINIYIGGPRSVTRISREKNCAEWLKDYLGSGVPIYEPIKEAAREAGFTRAELKAARKLLGVKTWHQGDKDAGVEHWFWYLPEAEA